MPGLSLLVYGRNDKHGYNIDRRAALSLNAMGEVLDDSDEILFCDCNSSNWLPTFPESIADTLTDRTRSLLRIIRIRPEAYRRLAPKTRLPVSEPLCRNVLLRRCQPETEWILSSNSDMLFLTRQGESLFQIARSLPSMLHLAPRMEVPESLWERWPRNQPGIALEELRRDAARRGLEIPVHCGNSLRFDGPGDFQLIPRSLLEAIDGFNESILCGWHVDGNLCKRAELATGANGSLEQRLAGFHCDHNRAVSASHVSSHSQESMRSLVLEVSRPDLPLQRSTWGAPNETFEEIRLDRPGNQWIPALLHNRPLAPSALHLAAGHNNEGLLLDPPQAIPHIASHLETWPRDARIAWIGGNPEMVAAVQEWSHQSGRSFALEYLPNDSTPSQFKEFFSRLDGVHVLLLDGHTPAALGEIFLDPGIHRKPGPYRSWYRSYRRQLWKLPEILGDLRNAPHLYVLGMQNTWLEQALDAFVSTLTPFASRVRTLIPKPRSKVTRLITRARCFPLFP